MSEQQKMTLAETVATFLATLSPEQQHESQQVLTKFVRWYGGERPIDGLGAREIGNYSASIPSSVADAAKRQAPVRSFLSFAWKRRLTVVNLAPHLRISKAKQGRLARGGPQELAPVNLTHEGHATLESELEALKSERPRVAEQLRLAAADKDFRENAPLEAAREHQGLIEARIRELESTLKRATIIKEKPESTQTAGVGCTVDLCDLSSGEKSCYTLVSPSEANPTQGKLSIASPIGKALLAQEVGAVVEVIVPAGKLRYQIEALKG